MLILSQKGNVMVNMDSLQAITIYIFRNYQNGKIVDEKYRVMAWYGADEDDYWGNRRLCHRRTGERGYQRNLEEVWRVSASSGRASNTERLC